MPTALIVDDDPEVNRLLARLVKLRGYQARSAYTGGEALELARGERPDVVFLDLMLPDQTGFDVCRALKADPETSLIPVVVVSARLAEKNRADSYQAGANEFVAKPFTPDQVFRALTAADAWRREWEGHAPGREFVLCEGRDSLAVDRRLTGLRSLLQGRTPLDETAISGIVVAVKDLCDSAGAWGEHRGVDRVATVAYRLHEDRLTLTVRDEAGWFEGGHPPLDEGVRYGILRRGVFDEIAPAASGRELTLTRRFRQPD